VEELTCQELVELVTEYLDGALPPGERERFEAHVADCPGCDRYLAQMRTTITLARATGGVEPAPDVSGLLTAFRDWKRRVESP
jgi:anti-sigma factor RsiW